MAPLFGAISPTAIFGGVIIAGIAATGAFWRAAVTAGQTKQWRHEVDEWRKEVDRKIEWLERGQRLASRVQRR